MRYRTKPTYVEALQYTGDNANECLGFCEGARGESKYNYHNDTLIITFKVAPDIWVFPTEWIIKEGDNFSPMDNKRFREQYEPATLDLPPKIMQLAKKAAKQRGATQKLSKEELKAWVQQLVEDTVNAND
jgi:hypothetical protein